MPLFSSVLQIAHTRTIVANMRSVSTIYSDGNCSTPGPTQVSSVSYRVVIPWA
jgi:hypothetical protein